MDAFKRPTQGPQKDIKAWERRRRLQTVFAVAGLLLVIVAWGLRRTVMGKAFLVLGVLLVGAARGLQRFNLRCPVCGRFNLRSERREFTCPDCGFTHCDF